MTSDSNRGLASADEETKERVAREVGKALLGFLSDDILKQAQSNTVVVQQEKVDRVGFEPTTSAPQQRRSHKSICNHSTE